MSNNRTMRQRRQMAQAHRMDADPEDGSKTNVLLDSGHLTEAARKATKGGKKPLEGLYLPSGQKIEAKGEDNRLKGDVGNKEAQQELNLTAVARAYAERQARRNAQAQAQGKTLEDIEIEESDKRGLEIIKKTGEHTQIEYHDLFNFFDVDKDKSWGSIEFAQRMTDIGYQTGVEDASNLLYFAGVRDIDNISFNDFVQMMPKLKAFRRMLERDAQKKFADADVYGTGVISRKALRQVLENCAGNDGIEKHHVEVLVKRCDRERTGKIPYEFFIRGLFGQPPMLEYKPNRTQKTFIQKLFACGSAPKGELVEDMMDQDDDDTKI